MEGYVSIPELIEYMKREGLVFAKETDLGHLKLREQYLRRKYLKYKEIADAKLWGDLSKKGVEAIAKRMLEPHEIFMKGQSYYIHISAVERIAKNKGIL